MSDLDLVIAIPPPPDDSDLPATCDWGFCELPAIRWRWTNEHGWLPVCHICQHKTQPGTRPEPDETRCSCGHPWTPE